MTPTSSHSLDLELPIGTAVTRVNAGVDSDPRSGYARGRSTSYQEPRTWAVQIPVATLSDLKRFQEAEEDSYGGALALTFTPPDVGSSVAAFIVPGSFRYRHVAQDVYEVSFTLRGDPA